MSQVLANDIEEMHKEIKDLELLERTRPGLSSGEKMKLDYYKAYVNLGSSKLKESFKFKVFTEPFSHESESSKSYKIKSSNICEEIILEPASANKPEKLCSCSSKDIFNYGCRCGGK